MKSKSLSHVWLCDPTDYTIHGILLARIQEWVAFPFSRGSSQPRDLTQVSSIVGRFFTNWAIREASSMHWFSFLPPFLLFWANYCYRCQWDWGRNSWVRYLFLCLELSQMLICPHPMCHKRVTLFFLSPLQNISVHVRITPPYPLMHTRYLPAVIEPP